METSRSRHACGVVTRKETGAKEVVVAGGEHNGYYLNTVEIFNVKEMVWRPARRAKFT